MQFCRYPFGTNSTLVALHVTRRAGRKIKKKTLFVSRDWKMTENASFLHTEPEVYTIRKEMDAEFSYVDRKRF